MKGFCSQMRCFCMIGLLLAFVSAKDEEIDETPSDEEMDETPEDGEMGETSFKLRDKRSFLPWPNMKNMGAGAKMEECRRLLGSKLEITFAMRIPVRVVPRLDQRVDVNYLEADGLLCRGINKFRTEIQRFFGLGPDKYVYNLEEYLHYDSNELYYILVPFGK